jgi:predicted RNA-binding Zn-ribbon protein involved in translation (DUF1610 family)
MMVNYDGYPMCDDCGVELEHEAHEIYCCPICEKEVLIDCTPSDRRRIREAWAV